MLFRFRKNHKILSEKFNFEIKSFCVDDSGKMIVNVDSFLAYFQYAYVRALSDVWCIATTSYGIGQSCSFMARSIAYDPRTWTKKGNFLGPVLAPRGRAWSPFSLVFHTFSVTYILNRVPGKKRENRKNRKNWKKPEKPEIPEKTGKPRKTPENRKNRKNQKKPEKPEKTGKRKNRKKPGKPEKPGKNRKKLGTPEHPEETGKNEKKNGLLLKSKGEL
jgi:hypothetical protein